MHHLLMVTITDIVPSSSQMFFDYSGIINTHLRNFYRYSMYNIKNYWRQDWLQ